MKRIVTIISALMLILFCGNVYAQKNSTNDYNLKKAYEVLNEEKDEAKALDLVTKQLRETPDNVDALILRARLLRRKEDYASAMRDINHAIKVNKPKKSGTPNSTLHWWKAYIYSDLGDDENAAAAFKKAYELAKKDNKDNLQSISFDYGCALAYLERYDESDAVFTGMLAEDEADQAAMVGLARNMMKRGQNQDAADLLEKCLKYDNSYSEVHRFLMKAYKNLGNYTKAIDATIEYCDKADDVQTDSVLVVFALKPSYAEAQMKAKAKTCEEPIGWKGFLCAFYEHQHKYAEAVRLYNEMEKEYGHYDRINYNRSGCYAELGLYDEAISDITVLVEKDPGLYVLCKRADYYRESGRFQEAIADYNAAGEEAPTHVYPYYARGWCYEMLGNDAKALAEYDAGINLDETYAYIYLMRGEIKHKQGNEDEAKADFEKVLQIDTTIQESSCRQYALFFLGKNDEAIDWMERMIADDPENDGHYYDKACLYARMGRLDESVAALRTAFEKGYRSFEHIKYDDDMDPIRELPEFKSLIEEYKAIHDAYLKENELSEVTGDIMVTEIAVTKKPGGTFEIPCDINGLALQMIFDTGASDVTISSVEANFMFKNGYLSEKDIKGKKYYQIANGQISEGTTITLREVKIGDAVLHNVDASVVKSQRAPLLLGQSAMERFGTITIDNINNKLIIKH